MSDKPCDYYMPWEHHGAKMAQCVEIWQGTCHEPLSPHAEQPCPFNGGYPNSPALPILGPQGIEEEE